jgi:hypothetical protein
MVVIANNRFVPQLKRRDDACCEECNDEAILGGMSVIAKAQPEAIQFITSDFWIASCSCLAVAMTDNRSPILHQVKRNHFIHALFSTFIIYLVSVRKLVMSEYIVICVEKVI